MPLPSRWPLTGRAGVVTLLTWPLTPGEPGLSFDRPHPSSTAFASPCRRGANPAWVPHLRCAVMRRIPSEQPGSPWAVRHRRPTAAMLGAPLFLRATERASSADRLRTRRTRPACCHLPGVVDRASRSSWTCSCHRERYHSPRRDRSVSARGPARESSSSLPLLSWSLALVLVTVDSTPATGPEAGVRMCWVPSVLGVIGFLSVAVRRDATAG